MSPAHDESSTGDEITYWLKGWQQGDMADRDRLMEAMYPQLRRLTGSILNRRVGGSALQTTEVIHELYLQLMDQCQTKWQNRAHFFAIAGRLLRRLVVDHERHRIRLKRGGGRTDRPLEAVLEIAAPTPSVPVVDVLSLDRCLVRLEAVDDRATHVVELRYFAGLSHDEVAEALGIGRATVSRSWRFARAWLRGCLQVPSPTAKAS